MNIDYIIVQAGGKGTRLKQLTQNKPKALVPVNNLPMLFHLFRKYPDKKYIIIGDYQKNVFRKYLRVFAEVKYLFVETSGTGTCAGLRRAMELLPRDTPFLLMWSDLVLPEEFEIPEKAADYVGISETFPCRWSYEGGTFSEVPSTENGVAGLFVFQKKELLDSVPESGEFVRWLSGRGIDFERLSIGGTKEYGVLEEYKKLQTEKCRPFNQIKEVEGRLVKTGIDDQGKKLAIRESEWYTRVRELGYQRIPKIYSINPIVMEKINGKNIYEYQFSSGEKKQVLKNLVDALNELHALGSTDTDWFNMQDNYLTKTFERLDKVRNLIPYADEPYIIVNGRKCRNLYFCRDLLELKVRQMKCEKFCVIHGDCTFSNLMLRDSLEPVLIDPRGYFGSTKLYGDPDYDWAKLYYSIIGNYDRFNLKRFQLRFEDNKVLLDIESNGWEDMEEEFFRLTGADRNTIQLIHAIIWLSLTTYAWQDYDSICGAFYNGLYYLSKIGD